MRWFLLLPYCCVRVPLCRTCSMQNWNSCRCNAKLQPGRNWRAGTEQRWQYSVMKQITCALFCAMRAWQSKILNMFSRPNCMNLYSYSTFRFVHVIHAAATAMPSMNTFAICSYFSSKGWSANLLLCFILHCIQKRFSSVFCGKTIQCENPKYNSSTHHTMQLFHVAQIGTNKVGMTSVSGKAKQPLKHVALTTVHTSPWGLVFLFFICPWTLCATRATKT